MIYILFIVQMNNNDNELLRLRFAADSANKQYFLALCGKYNYKKASIIYKSFHNDVNKNLFFDEEKTKRTYVDLKKFGYDFNGTQEERYGALNKAIVEHGKYIVEKCCVKYSKYNKIVMDDWNAVVSL